MAIEQDWAAYADQSTLAATDTILARTSAGAGVEVPGSAFVRLDGSGYAGVGVSSPLAALHVLGNNGVYGTSAFFGLNGSVPGIAFGHSGTIGFLRGQAAPNSNTVADFALQPVGGAILIGTLTGFAGYGAKQTILWDSSSQQGITLRTNSGTFNGNPIVFVNNSNTTSGFISQSATSVSYNTSSDYRLKEDLKPLTGALDRILSLPVYDFRWKTTGERAHGFMAHEYGEVIRGGATGKKDGMRKEIVIVEPAVEPVFDEAGGLVTPGVEAVTRTELVPDYQGIDQSKVTPDLVGAVQEMAGIIEELRARVAALEAM